MKPLTLDARYLAHTLRPLYGFEFVGIEESDPFEPSEAPFPLIVLRNGELVARIAVQCDEEGNGPGFLIPNDAKGPGSRELIKRLDQADKSWNPNVNRRPDGR